METAEVARVLNTLADYFASGNPETDAAAKAVLVAGGDYETFWQAEIARFRQGVEWTGLRGPEAEILANALRRAVNWLPVTGDESGA